MASVRFARSRTRARLGRARRLASGATSADGDRHRRLAGDRRRGGASRDSRPGPHARCEKHGDREPVPGGRIALWVASIGGLALAVRSILLGPVPLVVAVVALAFYVGLVIVGVLVPRLEMFGDVTWRGDPTSGGVAL